MAPGCSRWHRVPERYRHSPNVAWVEDGDRVVVLRLDDLASRPLMFDAAAAEIWLSLGDGSTVDEVSKQLAERFEIALDVIRRDVATLVAEVMALGALVVEPAGPHA